MLNSGLQDRIQILRGDGCGGQKDLRRVHIAKAQGTGNDAEGVRGEAVRNGIGGQQMGTGSGFQLIIQNSNEDPRLQFLSLNSLLS